MFTRGDGPRVVSEPNNSKEGFHAEQPPRTGRDRSVLAGSNSACGIKAEHCEKRNPFREWPAAGSQSPGREHGCLWRRTAQHKTLAHS